MEIYKKSKKLNFCRKSVSLIFSVILFFFSYPLPPPPLHNNGCLSILMLFCGPSKNPEKLSFFDTFSIFLNF